MDNQSTLTLTGSNTYLGQTLINTGTTLIGTPQSLAPPFPEISVAGSINNNGALIFASQSNGTFAGDIFGSGTVTIQGGSATLTGSNSYTGETTINSGSTLIGPVSSFPAPNSKVVNSGNIIDNGTLIFNQALRVSGGETFAGSISGSGNVIVEGGNVNFTGTNTFKGGITTQNGGSYTGNTDSITGDIVNNGSVTFDQLTPGTYTGTISGSGSLIKKGMGPLTLTGTSPFTGTTTIKEGALRVQGALSNSHYC
ncbi:MAG: autotransporter-associated beta strand repeat-containing protein [Alphaproteobacteria bacterium]|nr:autotransporter-associated beta strand repeat-containing protein [Alphaproteobacteria bacterium]